MNNCTDDNLLNCAATSFPIIIGALVVVVLLLIALRFYLQFNDRDDKGQSPPPVEKPTGRPNEQPVKPANPSSPASTPSAKPTPLQLRWSDPPDLMLTDFKGDPRIQNDFADLITATLLSSQGWKQLPSRYHRDRGVGGLFIREVRGGGGCECLAVESVANGTAFDPASMSDPKLAADIAQLYELGAFSKQLADELMRGLHQGSSFFRKELWRHDLSSGLTTISELNRKGEKGRSVTRSNARLISALYLSLVNFDRDAVYLGQAPLEGE